MNNKPVAWWDGKEPSVLGLSYFKNDYCPIPLYTHPATQDSEPQSCQEADGCPTEMAVLKRFWRSHHLAKEHFEDEPQAEELHEILQSHNEPLNYEVTHPRWSKEKEMFASWEYPQKTYADGIEECAQRAEAYAYMSPNFTALAEELRAILKKASDEL